MRKLPKAPEFETPEEEDEFWQSHSPLDFEHRPVDATWREFRRAALKDEAEDPGIESSADQ